MLCKQDDNRITAPIMTPPVALFACYTSLYPEQEVCRLRFGVAFCNSWNDTNREHAIDSLRITK